MRWLVREFDELTPTELHDALQLRIDVFVVEQRCAYPELDGKDPRATHLLAYDGSRLIGYARWYSSGAEVVMGRIVVRKGSRGVGLAGQVMTRAFEAIGPRTIRISAQSQLRRYYQTLGFKEISEAYDDFGISHIDMVRERIDTATGTPEDD